MGALPVRRLEAGTSCTKESKECLSYPKMRMSQKELHRPPSILLMDHIGISGDTHIMRWSPGCAVRRHSSGTRRSSVSTLCAAHAQRQDSTAALPNVCHLPIMIFLSHAEEWNIYAKCRAPSDTWVSPDGWRVRQTRMKKGHTTSIRKLLHGADGLWPNRPATA